MNIRNFATRIRFQTLMNFEFPEIPDDRVARAEQKPKKEMELSILKDLASNAVQAKKYGPEIVSKRKEGEATDPSSQSTTPDEQPVKKSLTFLGRIVLLKLLIIYMICI